MSNELQHWGIKGMKWGRRRYQNTDGTLTQAGKQRYSSTSLKAAKARKENEKVDAGFKKWNENAKLRDSAIDLGKKATQAKLAYEKNPEDKGLKKQYKQASSEYKKALNKNTTYRKGVVRQEVGRDAARKYLSEAKRVKKMLSSDSTNQSLQKRYNDLMSKHDIERAQARRAVEVASRRSSKKASMKRAMTITVKTAAATTAFAAGTYAVNRYLKTHDVRINNKRVSLGRNTLSKVADLVKKGKKAMGYVY